MKIEPKFSVGDQVFHPEVVHETVQVTCPDCLGEKSWTAHTPSGEEIPISCPTCKYGYEVRGTIGSYEVTGRVVSLTVGSVRYDSHAGPEMQWSYMCEETGVGSGQVYYETKLFVSTEEAAALIPGMVERKKITLDEAQARSRGRNREDAGNMAAHYRAQIRQAKKDIAAAERGLKREAGLEKETQCPT
jgi:hypothetical protein